jgi:AAA+ ATPase superfamily predicted ATPase
MNAVYFTTKVATDKSFCNRTQESQILLSNIQKNQHTVVVAPRRYGKTSLVTYVSTKTNQPFARVDLFCVVYEEDICRKVAKGISKLIKQIASFSEKTISILEQCFKSAYVTFRAGQLEINVEFGKSAADPISQLEDLLEGLELLAKKHKQPVVLFFDEFQDVLKADETNKIQAVIRAVAQHSRYVTYIFSGSSRMMLNKIFDDKNQPLYMLCDKIILDRISPNDFKQHIQIASRQRWGSALSEEVISAILSFTESHPYYVNLLCDLLWEFEKEPDVSEVESCWDKALSNNKGKIIADLEPLNANRIKVIVTVALLGTVNEPNSKVFLDKVKLPLSSTQNAVKYLINYDYLNESKEGLKLTDPLMRKFIQEHYR